MQRSRVGVPALCQLDVQSVDKRAETSDQQQRKLEAKAGRRHTPIVADRGEFDNLVYDTVNQVVEKGAIVPTTVPVASTRRIETPNAIMTTLASPTLGASSELSLWQVEMQAGARGPVHTVDSEQLWTVLDGAIEACVRRENTELSAGDTLVLPGGVVRQILCSAPARVLVCGRGDAIVQVVGENHPRGTPAWIA